MLACRGWLEAEVAAVRPRMIVALGATAAQAWLTKWIVAQNAYRPGA